eukprot:TRINITY_DN3174_c1_g1_i10.p1 TRINITY_DN3174_c1_g1~~TRINITY_DN3174_c1_g1_i10.p1  ORF type:complete len:565 (+),score=197.54 TRINITY_DN3174_c1_g1_i10:29-1696(+)
MSAAVQALNPYSEVVKRKGAFDVIQAGAQGLSELLKTNLGPKGTLKMLVSGSGDIKVTKDGCVLLHQTQLKLPTAQLVARAATAQDDMTGDGTTSLILLIAEVLHQSELLMREGVHPRSIAAGLESARVKTLELLKEHAIEKEMTREELIAIARTTLRSKIQKDLADQLSEICVDAVRSIDGPEGIDLHMIERMNMQHRMASNTQLIRGCVLDHGPRHPSMPTDLENCFILTMNITLEYEKTTVNSSLVFENAEKREELVKAERKYTDDNARAVIALKRKVCSGENKDRKFVVMNYKGIDLVSLRMLADEGIMALRRVKRRNLERLPKMCGGRTVNAVEDLVPDALGFAEHVYVQQLGEQSFTFVEGVPNKSSVTILMKGSTKYTLDLLEDAVHDGLRAVKHSIEAKKIIPGAGAFEIFAHRELNKWVHEGHVKGKNRLGVQAFADSLLVIPKTLAANGGLDSQDAVIHAQEALNETGNFAGVDLETGEAMDPLVNEVWDTFIVKKHMLQSLSTISAQLLIVDEVIAAGISQTRNAQKELIENAQVQAIKQQLGR